MASNKSVTNNIYKASSSVEVAVAPPTTVVVAPVSTPAKTTITAPGGDTTQPVQVSVVANKGVIYKQGAIPVAGVAKH
jgi:hypothetical protein